MKNQIGVGQSVDVVVPAGGFTAGGVYVIGAALIGIAATTELVGATAALHLEGEYRLNKVSAQAWAVGDIIYYHVATALCTNVYASPDLKLGVAIAISANPSPTGDVRLNGAFGVTAA
jgi:predicted RecA/RadA family phage recombinase